MNERMNKWINIEILINELINERNVVLINCY